MNKINILEEFESKNWNNKLFVLRQLKGWSQREAAKKCHTTQKNYWNWENGKVIPNVTSRKQIINAFDVNMESIFKDVMLRKRGKRHTY